MRVRRHLVPAFALCLLAPAVHAEGQGFGPCRHGFSDDTLVRTESRGSVAMRDVQIDDRVWSFNQTVGKPGWSRIVRRMESGHHYKLLADFSEPGSSTITKACWLIRRQG